MTRRAQRGAGALVAAAVLGSLAVACGGTDEPEATTTSTELGAAAREGRTVAQQNGCTACHSASGGDSIGPSWAGLHGSTVELQGGRTVVADDEYLARAIQEPGAEVREGFRAIMPERPLEPEEMEAVLAYLRELGDVS